MNMPPVAHSTAALDMVHVMSAEIVLLGTFVNSAKTNSIGTLVNI